MVRASSPRVVKNVTQTIIDNVVKARRKPLDVPVPPLAIARRELQINGIDSVLQLRAYLDKRITDAIVNNTSATMREVRESALEEFDGVRRFTQRFKKAKWLKRVSKRIFKEHTPTRAHLAPESMILTNEW
ncbi:hypothetical protein AB1Y20_003846 [Prymnesium parvum]|uniref:Uncharacterized protein n=1 Tax=Prymnesium parvum TaxID=97485 RepID=A0AB34J7R0_PRYPA